MDSVILCYAPGDEGFAGRLASFLETNLPLGVSCGDAVVGPDLDLMGAVDLGLSAEVALVLLSPLSVPKVWHRKTWESVFFEKPKEYQTLVGFVLVSDCVFPALLRRERFFDASGDFLAAAREIKRWLLRPGETVRPVAADMEELRRAVADRPGTAVEIPVEPAMQFAHACAEDFEAVHRFDCRGRSRAGILGDIGGSLGLPMSGTIEENRVTLSQWCAGHRVLFVFAGVSAQDRDFATPGGRSSVIFTGPLAGELPGGFIRSGVADRVGWTAVNFLKALGRFAEALEVLDEMAETARGRNDISAVLRIEREQFWIRISQGHGDGRTPERQNLAVDEQLSLPFTESPFAETEPLPQ